jgi:hypothetical protein
MKVIQQIAEQRVTEQPERMQAVAIICDLCKTRYEGATRSNWATGQCDSECTDVSYASDTVFPGGGGTEVMINVDICPTCFMDKLLPWLQSQGVEVTTYTTSYMIEI